MAILSRLRSELSLAERPIEASPTLARGDDVREGFLLVAESIATMGIEEWIILMVGAADGLLGFICWCCCVFVEVPKLRSSSVFFLSILV